MRSFSGPVRGKRVRVRTPHARAATANVIAAPLRPPLSSSRGTFIQDDPEAMAPRTDAHMASRPLRK